MNGEESRASELKVEGSSLHFCLPKFQTEKQTNRLEKKFCTRSIIKPIGTIDISIFSGFD